VKQRIDKDFEADFLLVIVGDLTRGTEARRPQDCGATFCPCPLPSISLGKWRQTLFCNAAIFIDIHCALHHITSNQTPTRKASR
jgi:hypothetical protein